MTEEQKEYEAMELVKHLDKLQRSVGLFCRENDKFFTDTVTYFNQSMLKVYHLCVYRLGTVQPASIGADGRPRAVEHILELVDQVNASRPADADSDDD